jgi:competence protein ComGF
MKVQVIEDSQGKATGVFIPISDWITLKKKYKDLEALEEGETSKEQMLNDLKQAVYELKQVEQGQAKSRPAQELLDEL